MSLESIVTWTYNQEVRVVSISVNQQVAVLFILGYNCYTNNAYLLILLIFITSKILSIFGH